MSSGMRNSSAHCVFGNGLESDSFVLAGSLWATLLVSTIIATLWPGTNEWWKNLLVGSIVGAAAAPWVWLHFVRNFGVGGKQELAAEEALIKARAHQIWLDRGQPEGDADEH